ncbi:polysaccharide biosynthesis/export family protein [Wenyingzhuangia sp. IMCC45574]
MNKKREIRFERFVVGVVLLILCSCASRKDVIYLQDLNDINQTINNSVYNMIKYKVDDRITISISSINAKAAAPYNLPLAAFNTGGQGIGQQQLQSYLVDKNGEINFPRLGRINVLGKTRIELQEFLENLLKPFLPDAEANVQLVNFRISVLGEVKKPGEYIVNREKINVLQAIGLAGDLTIHGKRNDIKLVREIDGKLKYFKVDLRSKDLFSSEYFFLQQNDLLYVSPNKPQVNASASSPTASYLISATGLLVTIISILTR